MPSPFPNPPNVQAACAEAGLDAAITQAFLDFAARIGENPELAALAAAARDHLFEAVGDFALTVGRAEAAFGDDAPLLRGLMLLESIRRVQARQTARGVPASITRTTLERHSYSTLRDYAARNGRAGADAWIWSWYRTVGSGDLYRLGRLEFIPERWDYPFRVFENARAGAVIALLDADQRFDDAGYNVGPTTWATTLSEDEDAITGHPISPRGYALRTPKRLSRQDWHQVIGPAHIVLDLHVPGDIPLTLQSVGDALEQSGPFFARFYPDVAFVAFVCDSWLFSTQLETMLPADSNILRLQREGYLFPDGVGQDDFLNFTFGSPEIDPATAPRDTRLRRAILEHLARGETLRCGGFLYLRRDLPRFGSQPYRRDEVA
ncbi:MAG: acyltransferase domain-containing protein [Thermoflexales bacterium]